MFRGYGEQTRPKIVQLPCGYGRRPPDFGWLGIDTCHPKQGRCNERESYDAQERRRALHDE